MQCLCRNSLVVDKRFKNERNEEDKNGTEKVLKKLWIKLNNLAREWLLSQMVWGFTGFSSYHKAYSRKMRAAKVWKFPLFIFTRTFFICFSRNYLFSRLSVSLSMARAFALCKLKDFENFITILKSTKISITINCSF